MPDVAEAICIDSEEEPAPQPKRKKRRKQIAPQAAKELVPLPSCIDLDAEEKATGDQPGLAGANGSKAAEKPAPLDAQAVCLSSDEEGPALLKSSQEQVTCGPADRELEQRAQELADVALQNLAPAARAARLVKVKHSILARLRSQAETGSLPSLPSLSSLPSVAEDVPPPPPPEEARAEALQQSAQSAELMQQKQRLQDWLERNQERLQERLVQAEQQRLDPDHRRKEGERLREEARQKRKAIWSMPEAEKLSSEQKDGRLTANGWESSQFHNSKERMKFLRLMGGQKFAEAAKALEAGVDDDQVFELIAGEWVQAKEAEEEEEFEVNADAPTVELLAGRTG
ncbi:CPK28 [Symbiodinium natans]|uniref:CPK28 protein n=1 Tax=Symbiodinium natans TaxID=878477 RepID=A0A812S409_9DINO|nr:CPK28 [Symbiodinium natans]